MWAYRKDTNNQQETTDVKQKKIDETPLSFLNVSAGRVEVSGFDRNCRFKSNIRSSTSIREETSTSRFE